MIFVAFRGPKFRQPVHAVRVFLASLTVCRIAQLQIRRAARLMFAIHLFSNNHSCPIHRNGYRLSLRLQSW
jgi:hypothetical protein